MQPLKFLLFVFAFLLVASFSVAEVETEDEVLVLTNDNFDEVVSQEQFLLVEFYAPWCGHCKQLAPNYAAAAQQLKEEGSVAKLAKVDATVHAALGQRFGVTGYPTLKFFRSGNPIEYTGGRTKQEILQWISKKTGPATTTISTPEELETHRSSQNVVVVARLNSDNAQALENYGKVAGQFDEFTFLQTSSKDLLTDELKDTEEGIVLLKTFDEKVNTYTGDYSVESITEFVRTNSEPLINDFVNSPKLFSSPIKEHFFLFLASGESYDSSIEALREVAQEFRGRALFSYVDVGNPHTSRLTDFFAIKASDVPQVRYISLEETSRKFKPESSDVDAQGWKTFLQSVFDGTAQPFLKSEEPVPYSGTGVRVLTGKDHDEVAKDTKVNVFVEYYAPWCGHCKSLAPIWEQLAAQYDDNENVVIAKFDGTANEVAGVSIRGFPTLIFYPAEGESITYSGERDLKSLSAFVEENSVGVNHQEVQDEL